MKKSQLRNIIKEEFRKSYSITDDPNVEFDPDRIMRMMETTVDRMMDSSAHIERTLRSHPELEYKMREVEMDTKSLNHKLNVLKEKFSL
jgi:hypothetical protein